MARTPGSKNKPKDGAAVKTTRKKSLDTKIKEANKKIEDLKAKLEAAEKELKDLEDQKEKEADKIKLKEMVEASGITSEQFEEMMNKAKTEQA